jgi:hypothetical protein
MAEGSTVLTAKDAIARHVQWKITLQFAIAMREPLSEEHDRQIRSPQLCAIGRWLNAVERLAMKDTAAYNDLFQEHLGFHREMARVANLISGKRYDEASQAISADSSFLRSSKALALSIMAYDRIATIAVTA